MNMLPWLIFIALARVPSVFGATVDQRENYMPLAGTWPFRLHPKNEGVEKKWFADKLDDSVTLPGTTDANQKGVIGKTRMKYTGK